MKNVIKTLAMVAIIVLIIGCALETTRKNGFVDQYFSDAELSGPGSDADHDGVPDVLEMGLARKFFPQLNLRDGTYKGLENADKRQLYGLSVPGYSSALSGRLPFYAQLHNNEFIEIRYGIAWNWDLGFEEDPIGATDHKGDSETYAVMLNMRNADGSSGIAWEVARTGTAYWRMTEDFRSAHWGDIGDSSSKISYGNDGSDSYQTVFCSEGKHGMYSSAGSCNGGCFMGMDDCSTPRCNVNRSELCGKLQNAGNPGYPIDPIIPAPGKDRETTPCGSYDIWSGASFGSATAYRDHFVNSIPWDFYSVTVRYKLANGNDRTETATYTGHTSADSVSITTADTFDITDPHGGYIMTKRFYRWNVTGLAEIEATGASSTIVNYIRSNIDVEAEYTSGTPVPTQAPESTTAPAETIEPQITPPPTDAPTPLPRAFTCTVSSRDSNGNPVTEVFADLTGSSTLNICTASTFPTGPTYQTFKGWNGGPCVTIDSPSSTCATVRNFTCDCSIGAAY